ncbi:MAG: ribonuclease HII [Anaerolineae bacterium]|nr:ribonuclease HII [Anaerolineae bacterium]
MPTLELELAARAATGLRHIVGIDEAGRGAIAGPVVAAAVILPIDDAAQLARLEGVADSKQLTPQRREELYEQIIAAAVSYGIGATDAATIDKIGILPGNMRAMRAALAQLDPAAEYLLVDGPLLLRNVTLPQEAVVRGDSQCLSIAAASILAKVTRDRYMIALDERHPEYGFSRHKGYCTREHVTAVTAQGPCGEHRHSFAPLRQPLL